MSELVIKVQAPELAAAVAALAAALCGAKPAPETLPPPSPVNPTPSAAPLPPQYPAGAPVTTTPTAPTAPIMAQAATPPMQQPPSVPVAPSPTYNREQIMTAGAALIDTGKINELMGLLNAFGVQAVTQLKQEQLGAFATELRKLGAQI